MGITFEEYEEILDALDEQDKNIIINLFEKYKLKPNDKLYDFPRLDENNNELETYLDYCIAYSLTHILDSFIDEIGLHYYTDDIILARCIELNNIDMYNYFREMGYNPEEASFKLLVQKCCSQLVATVLNNNNDFIEYINFNDIQEIFKNDLDEETIETVQVLINYGIDTSLFNPFLENLKKNVNDEDNEFLEEEKDIVIELIDLFENLDIPIQ
jgi:hypothetical protein